MRMLKIIGIPGLLILFLFLAACAGGGGGEGISPPGRSAQTREETAMSQPTETALPADDSEVKLLIYDLDGVRIYYRGFMLESAFGPQLLVTIENGMSIELSVYLFDFSVNGVESEASAYISIPPGDASDYSLFILNAHFDGVTDVEKLEFFFEVMNAEEDYRHVTDPITIDVVNPGA